MSHSDDTDKERLVPRKLSIPTCRDARSSTSSSYRNERMPECYTRTANIQGLTSTAAALARITAHQQDRNPVISEEQEERASLGPGLIETAEGTARGGTGLFRSRESGSGGDRTGSADPDRSAQRALSPTPSGSSRAVLTLSCHHRLVDSTSGRSYRAEQISCNKEKYYGGDHDGWVPRLFPPHTKSLRCAPRPARHLPA